MFRFADSRPVQQAGILRLVALIAAVAVLAGVPTAPAALASPPPTEAPVVVITAPVVNLHTGTATADGSVAVEERDTGTRARLDSSVLFAKNSPRLRPAARQKLRRLADQLRPGGPGRITVTGYTDDLGSAAHGLDLSRRRATAVAAVLTDRLGPGWPKIITVGRGEADPAVPNTSEKNRQLNRRVVITVAR